MGGNEVKIKKKKKKLVKEQPVQQKLLVMLIKHFGGPVKIAKHVCSYYKDEGRVKWHQFVNWRIRGYVPLKHVKEIAEALKVSPFVLNYNDYSKVAMDVPTWDSVIKSCKFLRPEEQKYLRIKKSVE